MCAKYDENTLNSLIFIIIHECFFFSYMSIVTLPLTIKINRVHPLVSVCVIICLPSLMMMHTSTRISCSQVMIKVWCTDWPTDNVRVTATRLFPYLSIMTSTFDFKNKKTDKSNVGHTEGMSYIYDLDLQPPRYIGIFLSSIHVQRVQCIG